MKRHMQVLVIAVLAAGFTLVSCGDDSTNPATGQVILQFITADLAGSIDSMMPVDDLIFINEAGQTFSLEKLVYFISRVTLVRTDGPNFINGEVAYIDASRGLNERRVSFANVPVGTYNHVRFTFGLNNADNVTDGLVGKSVINASSQDVLNMAWPEPLGGGYHYMMMEGKFRDVSSPDTLNYTTHTGRSGTVDNSFTIDLEIRPVTLKQGERWIVEIFHAFRQWYENPNLYALPANAMIMNDPAAQTALKENGSTVFVANRSYLDN